VASKSEVAVPTFITLLFSALIVDPTLNGPPMLAPSLIEMLSETDKFAIPFVIVRFKFLFADRVLATPTGL